MQYKKENTMKHLITALILCWFFTVPAAIATLQPSTPYSLPDGRQGELLAHPSQLGEEIRKLTASDAAAEDEFGYSVSISGDTAVVGAYLDDDAGSQSGSAYVFERNQGGADNWGEVKKLTASDAAAEDEFGYSVSISGDTAVVGAYLNDDAGPQSGSAYIFERNQGGPDNWGEVKKLTTSDAIAGETFGWSVSISGDTIVVGAYLDDAGNSGSAYVFARNQGGADNWGEVKKLTASDTTSGDVFGFSVSISGDTIGVGAPGNDDACPADPACRSGSAYVFARNQGGADNWGEVTKFTDSNAVANDEYGYSVSVSGDTIVVGARWDDDAGSDSGSAFVFERNQGGADNWGEVNKITASDAEGFEHFGYSVAISGDTIVVGARFDDDVEADSGSAYMFERNQGGADNWGEVKKLTASDAAANDEFGWSVSISGNTIVVGARSDDDAGTDSGSAYVFAPPVPTDLSITKTDSVDPVVAGSQLTYTVTVSNFGPGDAHDVVVTDTLPPGITFVSSNGCAEDPSGVPTCTLGTISNGGFDDYTITVTVEPATTGIITNEVDVSASNPETNPGDESAAEMTTITTSADLSIIKTDSADPVVAGNQVAYSITVTNAGPTDAQGVVVTETLPPGVTLVLTNGCAEDPLAIPTCTLGTISAGTQTTYVITVTVDAATIGIITNQATVNSSTPEANPGDESASESTTSIVSVQIFSDGFESGNTSVWSSVVGEL